MTPSSIFNDDVDIGFLEQFVNMPDSELEQLNFKSFPFPDLDFPLQTNDIPDFSVGMDNQLGMTVNNEPMSVLDFETSRDGMNSTVRRARTKGYCRPRAIDQKHCEKLSKRMRLTFPNEFHQNQNKTPDCVPLLLEPERKCTHCETTKTPQWRTGPTGRKTLCNACGVRYKSGRLFPEYRPASSPTFSPTKHSNSHKRILAMRKNAGMSSEKHLALESQTQSGFSSWLG
ncbi:unnamed protein product [Rhodiola kirilowii]